MAELNEGRCTKISENFTPRSENQRKTEICVFKTSIITLTSTNEKSPTVFLVYLVKDKCIRVCMQFTLEFMVTKQHLLCCLPLLYNQGSFIHLRNFGMKFLIIFVSPEHKHFINPSLNTKEYQLKLFLATLWHL